MSDNVEFSATRYAEIAGFLWKYRDAGIFNSGDSLHAILQSDAGGQEVPCGRPEEMAQDLEKMGPAFIKIGQSLSTRPDLISPPYIEALSQMQDNCSPVPFSDVQEIVELELGVRLTNIYKEFDESPLASASLGQVHRAKLRDGTEVAVKVQRPDAVNAVRSDLKLLAQIATKADEYSEAGRHFGFSDWVKELRQSMIRELDYETEAGNLETLSGLLEAYDRIYVPKPIWDFTSQKVLTLEFIDGIKVTERSGVRKTEEEMAETTAQLCKAFLDQMFVHGFVHVDPHPGNVLLTGDGRLVLLDLGMVAHLSPDTRSQVLRLVLSIVEGQGDRVADQTITMGRPLDNFDRAALTREVAQMVSEYHVGSSGLGEGMLMLQMTGTAASHGLRPPPEIVLLGKTLLNLEHLTEALAPGIDLKGVMKSHLSSIVRDRFKDEMKPESILSGMLETAEEAKNIPRNASRVLTMLAEKRFTMRVDVIDEQNLASNMQKIANRVAVGLIVAALIVAAALLMNVKTETVLWGYPAFALVIFMLAGILGVGLVISILWNDRTRK